MPSAAGSLCEACHGISLINVLVSVTTQHTHLAPTCPDAQPQEKLQGSRALTLALGPVPTPSRAARCVPTPPPCIPVTLMTVSS